MNRKKLTVIACVLAVILVLAVGLVLAYGPKNKAPQASGTAQPQQESKPSGAGPAAQCSHADENADHVCDSCQGDLLVSINIFAINDLHGKFKDSTSQPGVDELTTYLLNQDENTVILASGDVWQGSAESNLTQGAIITRWFNEIGLTSMTLGNHEFDWGETYLEHNVTVAEYPFLAINVFDRDTDQQAAYCQNSTMVERGGVRIGIIGAIGDCYSSISGDKSGGFYFKTGHELTALVKQEAELLRSQGADIIVYSIHDGTERSGATSVSDGDMQYYYDTSLSQGYVDIVFEAHTHQSYTATDSYGVYHIQGGGENRGISQATIQYDILADELVSVQAQVVDNTTYAKGPAHPIVEQLLQEFADDLAAGDAVLGHNGKYRYSDFLRQLVAELYYRKGMEVWGGEYDIVLGGGFISVRDPYNLNAGDVRYSQLAQIFPFDNQLVLCSIRGQELLDKFYATDNKNYFIYYEDYGYQVLNTIDRSATYYIVTDTYSSSYAPNRLTEVARYDDDVFARDLLADYIAAGNLEVKALDPSDYTLTPIAQLRDICAGLLPGASSKESYYVRGKVQKVNSTKYGNMTIVDEKGDSLYIYGTYDINGSKRYDSLDIKPQEGDVVVLYGSLMHYVNANGESVYEMTEARIVGIE